MKKLLSVLLAVMMLMSAMPVMADEVVEEIIPEVVESDVAVVEVVTTPTPAPTTAPICTDCAKTVVSEDENGVHYSCGKPADSKKGNCTEVTMDAYVCHEPGCGKTFEVENNSDGTGAGHKYVIDEATGVKKSKVITNATCTVDGEIEYECSVCGKVVEKIPALGHDWTEVVTEPTCLTAGYTTRTCKVCGAVEVYNNVDALGHNIGSEVYTEWDAAYCDKDGYAVKFRICLNKDCTEKVYLSEDSQIWESVKVAADHQDWLIDLVSVDVTEPTPEDYLYMAWDVMDQTEWNEDLGTYLPSHAFQIEDALTGDYAWTRETLVDFVAPTCTTAGKLVLTCSADKCGANVSVTLPALGHDYDVKPLANEAYPTCLTDGKLLVYCVNPNVDFCDFQEQINIDAPGMHNLEDGFSTFEQTTIKNGTVKDVTEEQFAEKIAECHPYTEYMHCGNWFLNVKLSNGENFWATIWCHEVGKTIEHPTADETLAAHTPDTDRVAHFAPTCTEAGYEVNYCSECGETTYTTLAALNHMKDGVDQYIIKNEKTDITDPTCTEQGLIKLTCALCGDVKEQIVPATGHSWDDTNNGAVNYLETIVVKEDCGKGIDEVKIWTCIYCGETKEIVTPFTHKAPADSAINPGEGNQAYLAPTCTENGERSFRCEDCHQYVTETIKALGHEWERPNYVRHWFCEENEEYYEYYRAADCQNVACYSRICDDCNTSDAKTVGTKKNHLLCATNVDGEVVSTNLILDTQNLPTCTTEGKAYYNCVVCGEGQVLTMPALHHNISVEWNKDEHEYEVVCIEAKTADWNKLFHDYLWDEIAAGTDFNKPACIERAEEVYEKALNDLKVALITVDGTIRGIGCNQVLQEIKVNATHYEVTMEGNKVHLKADDNVTLLDDASVLVSWAYTLSDGSSFTFSNVYSGKHNEKYTEWDFVVRAGKLQNATLKSITVVVTDNADAENVLTESAKNYGTLQEKY